MVMGPLTIAPAREDEAADLDLPPSFSHRWFMSEQSDEMKYGILGEDESTTEEKLSKYKGQVDWSYLKPHYEKDTLFFVDASLKLETVGVAITHDSKEEVAQWLKSGDLVKIEAIHAQQWEEDKEQQFEALVVSPFVLCCPV